MPSSHFPVFHDSWHILGCSCLQTAPCWHPFSFCQCLKNCQHRAVCRQLHPRICQESWKTGKCEEGMCGDGYHLGDGPGKPRTKNHYRAPGRQHKRAPRRITKKLTETDKTMKGDQGTTKGLTIQRNNIVPKQAENLKELDGQEKNMDNPTQNNSRLKPSETASKLSNWSLGFMIATICFIATIDVVMISSSPDNQGTLHARNIERQYLKQHRQN